MGCALRAALALFFCLFAGAAGAAGPASVRMPVGTATTTPIGWLMFCQDGNPDCRRPPAAAVDALPLPSGAPLLAFVTEVNRRINAAVAPMSDRALYGVEEKWTYPTGGKGDCEDYALAKRRALARAGIPLADLLLTVVRRANGEGHAVLTVRTDGGDLVLDNLSDAVRRWDELPYTFVKRQSSADPNVWVSVIPAGDVAVGAVAK